MAAFNKIIKYQIYVAIYVDECGSSGYWPSPVTGGQWDDGDAGPISKARGASAMSQWPPWILICDKNTCGVSLMSTTLHFQSSNLSIWRKLAVSM